MAAQHNSAITTLRVTLITLFLFSITVLGQENCDSVQEALQFWTNGMDSDCRTKDVKKLIDYYKDILKSKRANGKCRETIIIETRSLIANRVADVMKKSATQPEKAKEIPVLMQQLDADDGLLESAISIAYRSLARDNKQTKLVTEITKASDNQQKLRALIELDRLASEAATVEEIKTAITQIEKQANVQSDNKIKSVLTRYKKKCDSISENSIFTLYYPSLELQESIKNLTTLRKSCTPLSQDLADLEEKSTKTWIYCYAKMNLTFNKRVKDMKNKVHILDSTLQSMQDNCKRTSGMQFSNNNNYVENFQNVLKDIRRIC